MSFSTLIKYMQQSYQTGPVGDDVTPYVFIVLDRTSREIVLESGSRRLIGEEAEWVKAGSWPVKLSSDARVQRKYPWGDTMDRSRVNLWGSGPSETTPVAQLPEGVSVGGVYDLIGNVWEWTRGSFSGGLPQHHDLVLDFPMKSILLC